MKRRICSVLFTIALTVASTATSAEDWVFISSEGHQYQYVQNSDGAVLKSLYPVARFHGTGAMTEVITGIETLYLGRNCDASSKVLGSGAWAWSNGGFVTKFDDHEIWFPKQEIDANNGLACENR